LANDLGKTNHCYETGAGQHGVVATVCALMECMCTWVKSTSSVKQNVARMKMLGIAEVRPAMSGSKTLKDATNEAIRD
jgi:tryptophan synthase beta chain